MFKKKTQLFFWLGLIVLIFAIYAPSLNGPPVLDDTHTVGDNTSLHNPINLLKSWTSSRYYTSYPLSWVYRPVTTFSNILMWQIGEGANWPFHAFKLIVFIFLCFLLIQVWQKLLPDYPKEVFFSGLLLFVVNPVHTQVLSYMSATSTLLAAFFVVYSVWLYLKYIQERKMYILVGSLLCGLLAVLSKEEGVVFLAIIPLVQMCLNQQEGRNLVNKYTLKALAFYLFPALLGVWLLYLNYEPASKIGRGFVEPHSYFITQWRAYIRYIVMYFYSYDLNADNMEFGFSTSIKDSKVILALTANLALIIFALVKRKKWPVFTLAILWFYIGLSPASSIVALAEPVNDHRAFSGYMGFSLVSLIALNWLFSKNRKIFYSAICLVLVMYSAMTFVRSQVWSDDELLWLDTVAKNPTSQRAYNNLAVVYMEKQEYDKVLVLLDKCSEYGPFYSNCAINRAITLASLGRDKEAEINFAKAVELDTAKFQSKQSWVKFLVARGLYSRAINMIEEVDAFSKGQNLEVRLSYIDLLYKMGEFTKARTLLEESRKIFGSHSSLQDFLK